MDSIIWIMMCMLNCFAFSLKAQLYWLLLSRTRDETPHGLYYTNFKLLESTLEIAPATKGRTL